MAAPYRRHRARRGATVVATALAALATCLSVNAAPVPATAAARAVPAASPPTGPPDVPAGDYRITLITGDRVALTVDAAGRIDASVEQWATWPGRSAERRTIGSSGPDLSDVQKLDNTVPASPPALRFGVRVSTGQSTAAMPAIAGLKLWTSVDGGTHWRSALVVPRAGYRDGERWFQVTSLHGGRPGQKLSLKAEAWDAAGNRVQQVVNDAATLS